MEKGGARMGGKRSFQVGFLIFFATESFYSILP